MAQDRTNKEYIVNARLNNVPNTSTGTLVGISDVIGSSITTLWDEGTIYAFPSAATVMTVSSSSANDTLGGTGANYVYIEYLDSNYAEQTLTLALNGTTAVSTVVSILRVNLFRVVFSGTGATNAGNVFIGTGVLTAGKPATVYGRITAGDGAAQNGVYTVPAGTECLFMNIGASSTSSKAVKLIVNINIFGTNTWAKVLQYNLYNSTIASPAGVGRAIPAKSDIRIDGINGAGSSDGQLAIGLLLIRSNEASQRV
jgi:hypothetical protein